MKNKVDLSCTLNKLIYYKSFSCCKTVKTEQITNQCRWWNYQYGYSCHALYGTYDGILTKNSHKWRKKLNRDTQQTTTNTFAYKNSKKDWQGKPHAIGNTLVTRNTLYMNMYKSDLVQWKGIQLAHWNNNTNRSNITSIMALTYIWLHSCVS